MFFKLTLATLLFLAASTNAAETSLQVDYQEANLIEGFQNVISKLRQRVSEAVTSALELLRKVLTDINNLASNVIDEATGLIGKIVDGILVDISVLKEEADKLGIDVSDCLKESYDQLMNVPANIVKRMIACVTDRLKEAESIVYDTIGEITSVSNIVAELEKEFGKCGNGMSTIICKSIVVARSSFQMLLIPMKVSMQVGKALQLVATVRERIILCNTFNVGKAIAESTSLSLVVLTCIKDKIQVR